MNYGSTANIKTKIRQLKRRKTLKWFNNVAKGDGKYAETAGCLCAYRKLSDICYHKQKRHTHVKVYL